MRLTQILNLPPKFHFWKDFGAGKKRRIGYYKNWWNIWRHEIAKKKIIDHTLPASSLPPGSRLMEPEEFMREPYRNIVYDHPWPYNYEMDTMLEKKHCYNYTIDTRFFTPKIDCQALTNTLLESDELEANPPFELAKEDIDNVQRQYDWSINQDSVLTRLPRLREWPKINIRPVSKYGPSKERQETNVLNSMLDYSHTLLAKYYHQQKDQEKLNEILSRRSTAFPRCNVQAIRDNEEFCLNLIIDSLTVSKAPLPLIEPNPNSTTQKNLIDISPRSWRSVLEKSKQYSLENSLVLPPEVYPHTIQLASRIKRVHKDPGDLMARCMVHAFGTAFQYKLNYPISEPVVVQAIGFELPSAEFYFMRYQLNSTDFNGPIKNQAWCSKPISNVEEAMRYYLDFQALIRADHSSTT